MSKKSVLPLIFTMKQYADAYGLTLREHDTPAQKLIADHLRSLGYEQRRIRKGGVKAEYVWQKSDRKKELANLSAQLAEIKKDVE